MMKDIPGYGGTYKINECGNVINKNGHVMRTAVSNSGYLRTSLELPGTTERKNESIHRLVAETFIPNPDNLPIVMHIDNDPFNNHVSNLRWGTQQENVQQSIIERRRIHPNSCAYEVYNAHTGDTVYCDSRSELADTICYAEISLKNMVGNGRIISQGPYMGYQIRNVNRYDHSHELIMAIRVVRN